MQTLGIDDFGLYGIVGSVIVMFNALRSLFASSIQRYINVAKGLNDQTKVNQIFCIGVIIHIGISLIFLIAAEIGGLIMIPNLNIPPQSVTPAYWILQFSILATIVSILTVPYDALIIANERFNAYAILSIVECLLKLFIVYLLIIIPSNKVIAYSCLLFLVQLMMRFANAIYCSKSFRDEVKFHISLSKPLLKEMSSFAGWQFMGNLAFSATNAGTNILINLFGGVAANAARTIAYQVMSIVQQFTADISISFTPQMTQSFATDKQRAFSLAFLNSKVSFIISTVVALPILCITQPILQLWLGEVPPYTVEFVQVIMLYVVVRSLHAPVDALFKADGNIKFFQCTELIILLINIPASWFILKLGAPMWSVFLVMAILEFSNLLAIIILAFRQYGFPLSIYISEVLLRAILCALVLAAYCLGYEYLAFKSHSFIYTVISAIVNASATFAISSIIVFNKKEIIQICHLIPFLKKLVN